MAETVECAGAAWRAYWKCELQVGFGERTRSRTWLRGWCFSADARSGTESKKKSLAESQIGQELLSEVIEESSIGGSQGLRYTCFVPFFTRSEEIELNFLVTCYMVSLY